MPQLRTANQPVIQVTVVDTDPGKQDKALSVMAERARFMARQPGFVSITLHRSLDRRRIVNYVQWQSRELLEKAHRSPEFRKEWDEFDRLTADISPSLYEIVEAVESTS